LISNWRKGINYNWLNVLRGINYNWLNVLWVSYIVNGS
jgi:hypothetical protein